MTKIVAKKGSSGNGAASINSGMGFVLSKMNDMVMLPDLELRSRAKLPTKSKESFGKSATIVVIKKNTISKKQLRVEHKKLRAKQLMIGSGIQSIKIPDFKGGWIDCGNPIGSKRKYFESLHFLKNSWVVVEGKRYYLGSDEYMVTDLKKIDGHYYYFESNIKNGKETAGYMITYWHEIKGKRYYFGRNGKMVTSKVIDWKGKKYYVEKNGVMAVNKTIVDSNTGKTYKADEKGVLTEGTGNVYAIPKTDSSRLSKQEQLANADYIYNYLIQKGWTTEAICGLFGNMQRESHFNPGVWENQDVTTGYISGYGLVQWTPSGDKFLNWANLNANSANNMAKNNQKQLIDLQLEYLIYSSLSTTSTSLVHRQWYKTTGYGSPKKMTHEEYTVSTLDAGDLALVFHGSYERSNDTATVKQERKDNANRWYDYFIQKIVSNDLFK